MFKKGDMVEIDGLLAAIVGNDEDEYVPEDHIAVWFGDRITKIVSDGGVNGASQRCG